MGINLWTFNYKSLGCIIISLITKMIFSVDYGRIVEFIILVTTLDF